MVVFKKGFMGEQYYCLVEGKRSGPFSLEELKDLALKGELKQEDSIWCKTTEEWQSAGTVAGLFDELAPWMLEIYQRDLRRYLQMMSPHTPDEKDHK